MRFMNKIERWLLICGLLLIAFFVAAFLHRAVLSRMELKRFHEIHSTQPVSTVKFVPDPGFKLDFGLWSPKRIRGYEESLKEHFDPALAVLRIAKLQLEVPVLEGTDELALNRGVGHIVGTVRPGEAGNVGIAGHRDGFFRGLKDVAPGDKIELVGPSRTDRYIVDRIVLVQPDDVSVLQTRPVSSLTLVTCYPFYYVGSAPQRYIVQASLSSGRSPRLPADQQASSKFGEVELEQSSK